MSDSFQKEIPKARINITLDVETEGARKKRELPLKILALGDFSKGKTTGPVAHRERININKNNFDQVLATLSPTLNLHVPNTIKNDGTDFSIQLVFKQFKDFHPDQLALQIPQLSQLLSMRNLLKDLKSNLLDNHCLRKELEKLAKDKLHLSQLHNELKTVAPLTEEV
jgi:type VI secretion system protein ImpB